MKKAGIEPAPFQRRYNAYPLGQEYSYGSLSPHLIYIPYNDSF
jgi:hypothetical protein